MHRRKSTDPPCLHRYAIIFNYHCIPPTKIYWIIQNNPFSFIKHILINAHLPSAIAAVTSGILQSVCPNLLLVDYWIAVKQLGFRHNISLIVSSRFTVQYSRYVIDKLQIIVNPSKACLLISAGISSNRACVLGWFQTNQRQRNCSHICVTWDHLYQCRSNVYLEECGLGMMIVAHFKWRRGKVFLWYFVDSLL